MLRALMLAVNGSHFAVPMDTVYQVVRRPVVTEVPLAPVGLIGVVNVRGDVVPFLDTGLLTRTGSLADAPFAILVQGAQDTLLIAADELPVRTDLDEQVGPGTRPGELGMYSHGALLVMLVDIEALASSRPAPPRAS
ncbi:MAG TPA: chemotaxis protein CheW [Candidatus Dormibacteraeota bacterium]|jgi:purine-binding chemotaxis protein CheW